MKEAGSDRRADRHSPTRRWQSLIRGYTREAGLRRLERAIGRLTRKVALRFAEGNTESVTFEPDDLVEMLGPEPFTPEEMRKNSPAGVVDRPGLDRDRRRRALHRSARCCRMARG